MKLNYDFYTNHNLERPKSAYARKGLCGLVNLGNKCFMISVIQCLSNTLKLTDYLLSNQFQQDREDYINTSKKEFKLVLAYAQLMSNVWNVNELLKPKSITDALGKFVSKYQTSQQQDSHECLLYMLEIMHKGMSYSIDVEINGQAESHSGKLMKQSIQEWKNIYENNYSCIIQMFGGMLYNSIDCQHCSFKENVFEPFLDIGLDLPQTDCSLIDCLDSKLNHSEAICTWKCESCSNKGCTKHTTLWTLPNYLIIHLKRFKTQSHTLAKNNALVDFPIDSLDLSSYVSSDKNDKNNYIYSLYAVNYHSGNLHGGHYHSACKNLDDNWYQYNDGNISKYQSESDIPKNDAYILFYYRKFIK